MSRNYPLLLGGQFLGAFGDNFVLAALLGPLTFQLVSGKITEQQLNAQNALFSAVFFVPFIVLAPLAGFLNDRWPKTSWLVGGNALKFVGALIGLAGVAWHGGDFQASRWWQVVAYAVIGIGACLYSPAKYGVLPEIVSSERLVKANGTVEMLTLVAILGGLWGGATLYDHVRSLPICYGVTAGLYALALACNTLMTRTPHDGDVVFKHSVADFGSRLSRLIKHPRLARVLLGCGVFWFVGATLRGNLQAWGLETLRIAGVHEITNEKLAMLKVGLILGVVAGCVLAGQLHRTGDLSWCRRYGVMVAVAVAALGAIGGHFGIAVAVILLVVAGLVAGLLLIPLNAALQNESPAGTLGKAIAVQNFVDYCSMLLGAIFLQVLTKLGVGTYGVFVALGGTVAILALGLRIRAAHEASEGGELLDRSDEVRAAGANPEIVQR